MPTLTQLLSNVIDILFSAVVVIVVGRYTSWGRRAVSSKLALRLRKVILHPLAFFVLLASTALAMFASASPVLVSMLMVFTLTWLAWRLAGDRMLYRTPPDQTNV